MNAAKKTGSRQHKFRSRSSSSQSSTSSHSVSVRLTTMSSQQRTKKSSRMHAKCSSTKTTYMRHTCFHATRSRWATCTLSLTISKVLTVSKVQRKLKLSSATRFSKNIQTTNSMQQKKNLLLQKECLSQQRNSKKNEHLSKRCRMWTFRLLQRKLPKQRKRAT